MPIYMKIEGIKGDVQERGYEDAIEIYSFSWGVNNTGAFNTGAGAARAGKAEFSAFAVAAPSMSRSALYMDACARGVMFARVLIDGVRQTADGGHVYQRYELREVYISSYQVGGSGDDMPIESMSLNFTKISYTTTEQKADGSTGESTTTTWDVKKNAPA